MHVAAVIIRIHTVPLPHRAPVLHPLTTGNLWSVFHLYNLVFSRMSHQWNPQYVTFKTAFSPGTLLIDQVPTLRGHLYHRLEEFVWFLKRELTLEIGDRDYKAALRPFLPSQTLTPSGLLVTSGCGPFLLHKCRCRLCAWREAGWNPRCLLIIRI